mmetsp:Transcript_46543/g.150105  ORF Transcript_46543/g.150105 Transcript_46543/m.150105 type:complete len:348 (-) Transcript_46543:1808-2851(-)
MREQAWRLVGRAEQPEASLEPRHRALLRKRGRRGEPLPARLLSDALLRRHGGARLRSRESLGSSGGEDRLQHSVGAREQRPVLPPEGGAAEGEQLRREAALRAKAGAAPRREGGERREGRAGRRRRRNHGPHRQASRRRARHGARRRGARRHGPRCAETAGGARSGGARPKGRDARRRDLARRAVARRMRVRRRCRGGGERAQRSLELRERRREPRQVPPVERLLREGWRVRLDASAQRGVDAGFRGSAPGALEQREGPIGPLARGGGGCHRRWGEPKGGAKSLELHEQAQPCASPEPGRRRCLGPSRRRRCRRRRVPRLAVPRLQRSEQRGGHGVVRGRRRAARPE